jgi:O-antigen/teichoic acid export membrane protein
MGIVSKTSVKFSIIVYIGIALGYVNTVLIFPNILSDEVFGLTRILFTAAALIAQITQLGTGNILVRFHPYLKNDAKNTTLSIGLFLSFLGIIISSLFIYFFQDWLIEIYIKEAVLFTEYFYLLLPCIISLIAYNLFDAYLRILMKNSFSAFLSNILLRLIWLGIVVLYGFGYFDTKTFMNVYVGAQILISTIALLYTLSTGKLNLGFSFTKEKLDSLKSMLKYGGLTILSGISFILINRIDMLMIGGYTGLVDVAIYSIAFYMSTVILVPAQSISRTAAVLVSDAYKNNNQTMIKTLYQKTALNQLLFGSIVFILITINYKSLMSFLPSSYADSFYVFFLLGLGKIIDTGLGVNGAILLNSKYYKVDTILSVALLVFSIVLKIYFIPEYGIVGAAASTAIALILYNLAKFLFLYIKMGLTPFTWDYIWLTSILTVSFVIMMSLPFLKNIWIDVPIKTGSFLLMVIPLVYVLKISPEFNEIIDNFKKSILKIIKS